MAYTYTYIPRGSTSTWIVMQSNQSSQHKNSSIMFFSFILSLIIIVIITTIACLFADYLLLCLRRRRQAVIASTLPANHSRPVSDAGLVASAVASLPTFVYRSSDDNNGSESQCAVCLSAAKEGEMMRMLPNCKHFFHVKCIDVWLNSHPTCPICRSNVKRWRAVSDGRLLASATMPARVGGVRDEEWSMAGLMVKEGRSMLRKGSSFCRRLSIGRRQGQVDNVVEDLERQ